jgi:Protein of unknown function (DUF664)
VPDQKPPRLAVGEAETLRALLQFQRQSLVKKGSGVDELAAAQSSVSSGTSLRWLITHLAQVELTWILVRFAGQDWVFPDDAGSLDGAVEFYRGTWARVDAVAFAAPLDQLCRRAGTDPPMNLRWVLMHLLEETARW